MLTWRRAIPLLALNLGLVAASGDTAAAQDFGPGAELGAAPRVSLAEALRLFETNNLDLRVARSEAAVAEARVRSAGAVPNPGLAATREQLSREDGSYDETVVTLGQTLEIGGQRGARLREARLRAEAAGARLEAERTGLAYAVYRAYIRAAAAEADLAAVAEATEVFRRVEESGRIRFAEGDISRFDRSRLQVERARYETLLAEKVLELETAARELAILVAPDTLSSGGALLPADALAGIEADVALPDLETALLRATERAEVRAAEVALDAARAARSLARRERIPDLTLSGGYKHQADGFQGAVIGVSLPVPLWNRNAGEIAAAEASVAAAEANRDLALAVARSDIRRAWERLRSLDLRRSSIGETLMPESAGLLETARVAYAEGEMTLIELLDAADAYRSARESVNRLLGDLFVAHYDLQRATGSLLEDSSAARAAPAP